MKEDITRILKMVEEGKVDASKASELLEALNASPVFEQIKKADIGDKMLKIRVISGDKDKVNVNLPIKFVKGVLRACGKIPISANGMDKIDVQLIADAIESGIEGKIVDVQTADGDIIEVIIE